MKVALIQFSASDDPSDNAQKLVAMAQKAYDQGARLILTPEVSNIVSLDKARMQEQVVLLQDDFVFQGMRDFSAQAGVEVIIGSLAVQAEGAEGKFANRSVALNAKGQIVASYDKIHLFDANPKPGEFYRESDRFIAGNNLAIVQSSLGNVGMSICYDVRFAHLYRTLAQQGSQILNIPAAFSVTTGQAHWETLLRARAIETGCYVLAAAQCGAHPRQSGPQRYSYGHSMAIDPWGHIIAKLGNEPDIAYVELDLELVARARQKVPAIHLDAQFS